MKYMHPQLTCEAGEIFLQVRGLDFVSQDVSLVEEEDYGGVEEPRRMDGGVEQSQTLMHTVLKTETDITLEAAVRGVVDKRIKPKSF